MKRLLLIILIVAFVFSIATPVLAKVSFGNWDRWDEELPPADNDSWYWTVSDNESRVWNLKGFGDEGTDVILLFSDLYFYGDKRGKTKSSAIFYSQGGNIDLKNWDIPNASLALMAFPPRKGKMIVRAYKIEKNKVFKFFEEWEIAFKDSEVVVPEGLKFREIFKEWLEKQISPERIVPKDMVEMMLPELVIWKEKFFMITDSTKIK